MKLAPLTVAPVPDSLLKDWISPLRDRRIRRDLVRVLRGISPQHTLAAAERLSEFDRPALIAWGMRDPFFPFSDAERLAAALGGARVERIENARTFVQLDAPERLATLVAEFATRLPRARTRTGADDGPCATTSFRRKKCSTLSVRRTIPENEAIGRKAGKAIALGVGAGLGTIGPGIGVGFIFGKVIESVTRQPEMRDEITSIQWLGFALTEAIVFYAFIFGLIAFFLS